MTSFSFLLEVSLVLKDLACLVTVLLVVGVRNKEKLNTEMGYIWESRC